MEGSGLGTVEVYEVHGQAPVKPSRKDLHPFPSHAVSLTRMDRAELERLDRTTLIARAESLGVTRANILTRPELVDELLVRSAKKDDKDLPRARGLFGRARDLVARVIEKGLHLPDAAERIRQVSVNGAPTRPRVPPLVVPTVTLAEIYAAQGHRARAVETLRRVLDVEPDHGAAEALLTTLETEDVQASPPPILPPEDEADEGEGEEGDGPPAPEVKSARVDASPVSSRSRTDVHRGALPFLDDDPLPIRYDVDECVAIAVDPTTLHVYWEVRDATLEHVQKKLPSGSLCLRLLVITPSWDGPRSSVRDFDVGSSVDRRVVHDLPRGAVVRTAIGWRAGETFVAIAHAPALETPRGAPHPIAADSFVRWTPRGLAPVTPHDSDYASIARALERLAGGRERRDLAYDLASSPPGSSELSAGFSRGDQPDAPLLPSSDAML